MDSTIAESGGSAAPGLTGPATRAEFGRQLTELRTRSGKTLRELAAAIDSSPSTVGDWCRGDRLPFPSQHETLVKLLDALGVHDIEPWIAAVAQLRDGPKITRKEGRSPYRGLDSFGPEDAEWFFGRADLVAHLYKRLQLVLEAPGAPRILTVVGASGSGKSSLLNAGLRPRLEDDGRRSVAITPGRTPASTLHAAVGPGEPGIEIVIVDQFEEAFTLCEDPAERDEFIRSLQALADPTGSHATVIGLRIDYYPQLGASGLLSGSLPDAQVVVGPMDRCQLRQAIVEPAQRAGYSVDDTLLETLLAEFVPHGSMTNQHDAGSLPLLSHALQETWHHASRGRLTLADYHASGGLRGAVEESAERAFDQLTPPQQAIAKQAFIRLVHLDDALATRRAASLDELHGLVPHADGLAMAEVLGPFIVARLLTAKAETIEITHEALLAAWPRLRGWIEEDRDALRLHRRITDATSLWLETDRDPSALAAGMQLESIRAWIRADAAPVQLTDDERAFISASEDRAAAAERSRRRRARRLMALASVTTALAVLAATFGVLADRARSEAITARDEALSRQLAMSAERLGESDPSLAAQLAVAGYRVAPTAEARSALLDASIAPRAARYLGGAGPTAVTASSGTGLVGVSNAVDGSVQLFTRDGPALIRSGRIEADDPDVDVYALAVTPDDSTLAVGDTAAEIHLWNVTNPGEPRRVAGPLTGPTGPIQRIAITQDGRELAASGMGEGIFRWDISDASAPRARPLIPSGSISWGLAYSADGRRIAFGKDTGEIQLWEIDEETALVAELTTGESSVFTVAFSPDGRWLAGGGRDGTIRVWDITDPAAPAEVELVDAKFGSWVNTASFSPDGTYLLAGSSDASARIWETATWAPVQELAHPAGITQASFTDDGRHVVTAGTDGTARLWDLGSALPTRVDGRIFNLRFTPEGDRMAAFAGLVTQVWDLPDSRRPVPVLRLVSPDAETDSNTRFSGTGDLSPDGELVAQGAVNGSVYVADISDPGAPRFLEPLGGSDALVEMVDFNPDGNLLAAGGDDATVRVWDFRERDLPRLTATLGDATEIVLNVVWDPSGQRLAANSADGLTYLYDFADPDNPRLLSRLDGFDSESYATAFSPNGDVVAVGGSDQIVFLWDISDPASPRRIGDPIRGPVNRIYSLDFSQDATLLAAAVTDGTTWVWDTSDLADPSRLAVLGPSDGLAFTVAFSPDDEFLASAGSSGEVSLWPTSAEAAIERICATIGDPMTADEWDNYVPDRPFRSPC